MPFNLPALDRRCVHGQAPDIPDTEDAESEQGDGVGDKGDKEVGKAVGGRSEVGRQITGGPYFRNSDEEQILKE